MTDTEQIEGGCLCGQVRYRACAPWSRFVHCHCERCRRATGTGHATNLLAPPEAVTWLAGESATRRYDLPTARSFATAFCTTCGSPLPHLTRNGRSWVIPAGSLDREPAIKPSARICWSSRTTWSCDGDALERVAEDID